MEKIAITGLGIISPSGIDKRVFWANIKAGRSAVEKIERFDASLYPSRIAGQVKELEGYSNVSSRLLKKIDLFSHMALVASELALEDAKINLAQENLKRVGIFMGNAIGGWFMPKQNCAICIWKAVKGSVLLWLRPGFRRRRRGRFPFITASRDSVKPSWLTVPVP